MKHLTPILFALLFTVGGQAQEFDLFHNVYPTAKGFTLTLEELDTVVTLIDLNKHYEEDWVETYQQVTLTATVDGRKQAYSSKDDTLTTAQLAAIRSADNGTPITIALTYFPVGYTEEKTPRANGFSFVISPQTARYKDGKDALLAHLHSTIDEIPREVFSIYQAYAVDFTVDHNGAIIDAAIQQSTDDSTADALLLDAICNMPRWQPATYPDGETTKQNFVFVVGDKTSCTMNVLSIEDWEPEQQ
jgi:hypothetical protein